MNTPTDNHALFKQLVKRPYIAWPTLGLFVISIAVYAFFTWAGITGLVPMAVTIGANTLAAFWLFTVFHDAAHNALSLNAHINNNVGRVSILAFSPFPIFKAFRFIHMQHHRFTNESKALDPDAYVAHGPAWLLPFKWATIDCYYYYFYLTRLRERPRKEQLEFALTLVFSISLLSYLISAGHGELLFWCWFVPSRITLPILAFAFDFLPHYPYNTKQSDDKFRATNIRKGFEWLLSPVLLYQNYHLVHHLYPLVPFYRYIKVWRAKEAFHLEQKPLMVKPFALKTEAE